MASGAVAERFFDKRKNIIISKVSILKYRYRNIDKMAAKVSSIPLSILRRESIVDIDTSKTLIISMSIIDIDIINPLCEVQVGFMGDIQFE